MIFGYGVHAGSGLSLQGRAWSRPPSEASNRFRFLSWRDCKI